MKMDMINKKLAECDTKLHTAAMTLLKILLPIREQAYTRAQFTHLRIEAAVALTKHTQTLKTLFTQQLNRHIDHVNQYTQRLEKRLWKAHIR